MSVIESTRLGGYVTSNDSMNFSKSNQKYSFGVGNRFPSMQKKATNTICYEMGSTLKKRTCGFGIGTRFGTADKSPRSRKSIQLTKLTKIL